MLAEQDRLLSGSVPVDIPRNRSRVSCSSFMSEDPPDEVEPVEEGDEPKGNNLLRSESTHSRGSSNSPARRLRGLKFTTYSECESKSPRLSFSGRSDLSGEGAQEEPKWTSAHECVQHLSAFLG